MDRSYYGCATYKQGGLAACANTARIKRDHVEAVLLAEIDAEILSDEAVACAQKAIQDELRRLAKRDSVEPSAITPKLAKLDGQADALRAILKIVRVISQSAQLYRAAVRTLNATLSETSERQEARALVAELLGGQVKVRKEGDAVYARLELDANVLLAAAANSSKSNDFQIGSGQFESARSAARTSRTCRSAIARSTSHAP